MEGTKRIQWIDDAKLVCMFFVVMAHNQMSEQWLFYAIHTFVVPTFFFLSGLTAKERPVKEEIRRASHAILVPYFWLYLVCYLCKNLGRFGGWILHGKWGLFVADAPLIAKYLMGLFVGCDSDISVFAILPLWFLPALFWCRVLYSVVTSLFPKERTPSYYIAHLVASVEFSVCALLFRLGYFCIRASFIVYLFFVLGAMLKDKVGALTRFSNPTSRVIKLCACALLSLATVYMSKVNGYAALMSFTFGKYPPLLYLGGFCGVAAVLLFCTTIRLPRWTAFFSHNTIIILPFHFVAILPAIWFILQHMVSGFSRYAIPVWATIPISLAAILLCAIPIYLINRFAPFMLGKSAKSQDPKAYLVSSHLSPK